MCAGGCAGGCGCVEVCGWWYVGEWWLGKLENGRRNLLCWRQGGWGGCCLPTHCWGCREWRQLMICLPALPRCSVGQRRRRHAGAGGGAAGKAAGQRVESAAREVRTCHNCSPAWAVWAALLLLLRFRCNGALSPAPSRCPAAPPTAPTALPRLLPLPAHLSALPCSLAVKMKSWATHRVELPELAVLELGSLHRPAAPSHTAHAKM